MIVHSTLAQVFLPGHVVPHLLTTAGGTLPLLDSYYPGWVPGVYLDFSMQWKQVRWEYTGLTSPGLLKLCPLGLPETDMLAGVIQVPGADHSSKVSGTTPFSEEPICIHCMATSQSQWEGEGWGSRVVQQYSCHNARVCLSVLTFSGIQPTTIGKRAVNPLS